VRLHAAFLRGIGPTSATMPDLVRSFQAAGFSDVCTVLTSGNVVFGARAGALRALERKAEAAMQDTLGHSFLTIVRPIDALRALLEDDPFAVHRVHRDAKRVVTFLREPPARSPSLPVEKDGARILAVASTRAEVFTAYVPSPRGAVFMALIEKTFGREVTTRTWDTVKKVVARAERPPGR
jgi:uncharacterized protein (DUF1697 family)